MAFKKGRGSAGTTSKPSELFRTLTRRKLPDVMTHQRTMLDRYFEEAQNQSDVAIQLPTGSGKTLVALLIAEWRRRQFDERIVYLCPTRQLANQIRAEANEKYGLDVEVFTGSIRNYGAAQKTSYTTGSKVCVTTYSSLFNTNPFFADPDTIIIDDAHAAENYVVKMWSLQIRAADQETKDIFRQLSAILKPKMSSFAFARFSGETFSPSDASWVDKVPSPVLLGLSEEIVSCLDSYSGENREIRYVWPLIRPILKACHVYVSAQELTIRPILPPTWEHLPFSSAKQRIFMSATLGEGGDLERLTGRPKIHRIAAPNEFQNPGVGRRLFMFPGLSLEEGDSLRLRTKLQKRAGRSVVLTTSGSSADRVKDEIASSLPGYEIFSAEDIEDSKEPFIAEKKAVAVLAGRFDGIDFPEDDCRFLCLDGLPKASNPQERFLLSKMGAGALLKERINTRIIQAAGRCTRALQDRSAVYITGNEILHYLADNRNWKYFHPDLQAELDFGVEQSVDIDEGEFVENFDSFLRNDADWDEANREIIDRASTFQTEKAPGLGDLEEAVEFEIKYLKAMIREDYVEALAQAKEVLAALNDRELRGYRAWWHYLAGSAAFFGSQAGRLNERISEAQFIEAKKAAPNVPWLSNLAEEDGFAESVDASNPEVTLQVERIEANLLRFGSTKNNKLRSASEEVRKKLNDSDTFEAGLVELGKLMGFEASNSEEDSAPDPWWFGERNGIVFEANVGAKTEGAFGSVKARQAAMHPEWLKEFVPEVADVEFTPVIITPKERATEGCRPFLADVRLWKAERFDAWFDRVLGFLIEINGKLPPETDLAWRAEVANKIEEEGFSIEAIMSDLPIASDAFSIEGADG